VAGIISAGAVGFLLILCVVRVVWKRYRHPNETPGQFAQQLDSIELN